MYMMDTILGINVPFILALIVLVALVSTLLVIGYCVGTKVDCLVCENEHSTSSTCPICDKTHEEG